MFCARIWNNRDGVNFVDNVESCGRRICAVVFAEIKAADISSRKTGVAGHRNKDQNANRNDWTEMFFHNFPCIIGYVELRKFNKSGNHKQAEMLQTRSFCDILIVYFVLWKK